ncbi:hypothetical protein [Flectobacillus sp. BAB-3569]|uniref:hypothetical protein n=1 Tax=Flectobacillus sp. BAB-3569 TaxID=1509483 RepID=UPI000BA49AEA|nr:hypothetical protein [Flectobacillus sp. BAB-3569]PAC29226.1 hypothetical protein BWI92_16490 [Flectobacillus sp. BAB-3569]
MQIKVNCDNPPALLRGIIKQITNGEIETWEIKKNKKDEYLFSHSPEQWSEKAMMKPVEKENSLVFVINWWSKNEEPENRVKGYILGRFIELLMVHFREYFNNIEID